MKKIVLSSVVACSLVMAAGYKIPETSTNSVALSGANIAHSKGADAAYDNPANMVFMENKNHMEANLMYLNTSATKYTPAAGNSINADAQDFLIPSLHYVSPSLGESGARVGLSIAVPGGLSRTWNDAPATLSAEEFTLQVVEINPTAAFKLGDKVGVAVGFRAVHSSGVVKASPTPSSVHMEGDSLDFGYNFALAYQPVKEWKIGLTYRSQVNLTEEGSSDLILAPSHALNNRYDATVSIPLPATFNAAIAYTFPTKTTVEFVYEKSYWSAYRNLDFNYANTTIENLAFGQSRAKDWRDTNAYRLGITQELDSLTLMGGLVFDDAAAPKKTLGFESPDSRSMAFSFGGRYQIDESLDVGLAGLYSMKDDRTINAADANIFGINGEFTNSNVIIISAGVGYRF